MDAGSVSGMTLFLPMDAGEGQGRADAAVLRRKSKKSTCLFLLKALYWN